MSTLTAAQGRRVAVAAQGLADSKPGGPITRAHLKRLISRIQVLQLDSVSVAVRAHYAPGGCASTGIGTAGKDTRQTSPDLSCYASVPPRLGNSVY